MNAAEAHHASQCNATAIRVAGAIRIEIKKILPRETFALVSYAQCESVAQALEAEENLLRCIFREGATAIYFCLGQGCRVQPR